MHLDGGHLEGNVSQIFLLGPSFHFKNSRKKVLKNDQKLPVFWHEIKTKGYIKKNWESSLEKNVANTHWKFQIKNLNSKRDIDVQKIKGIKMV